MRVVYSENYYGTNVGRWHALDHNNHVVPATVARTYVAADALRNQVERDDPFETPWTPDEWRALTGY